MGFTTDRPPRREGGAAGQNQYVRMCIAQEKTASVIFWREIWGPENFRYSESRYNDPSLYISSMSRYGESGQIVKCNNIPNDRQIKTPTISDRCGLKMNDNNLRKMEESWVDNVKLKADGS